MSELMTERYHVSSGQDPEVKCYLTLSGPQMADQVPEAVRALLEKKEHLAVIILTDYGTYKGIIQYRKMPGGETT